jgi:hypothetical protein
MPKIRNRVTIPLNNKSLPVLNATDSAANVRSFINYSPRNVKAQLYYIGFQFLFIMNLLALFCELTDSPCTPLPGDAHVTTLGFAFDL